mmetsp:Transcript_21615/g.28934  ORF Transcript_21615/g.28934 Transcript_21615/m.28934 type:complete len:186 (-) Transcript_21615:915-1472(-)
MCVTGLDESLMSEDLHKVFERFGPVKSAKVAIDAETRKSKCYGYVWFSHEQDCKRAILEANQFHSSLCAPYPCRLFEMTGLRAASVFVQSEGFKSVTAINFPEDYSKEELLMIFEDMHVLSIHIMPRKVLEKSASWPQVRSRAEITFTTHRDAKDAIRLLNGVMIRGKKLLIKPCAEQAARAVGV